MKFIDLSKYNVVTNWKLVKANTDAVMIRAGYRGYGSGKVTIDAKAEEYCAACKANGIPFGLYFMSQAITEAEAEEEALFTVQMAKKYGATLPLMIDSEDGDGTAKVVRADGLSKDLRTKIAVKFCLVCNLQGYQSGVYASTSWFVSKLDVNKLLSFKLWVAQYASKCIATHRVDAWQYANDGIIPGISGRVDVSIDYSFLKKKVNPYPAPTRILKRTTPMMNGDDVKWLQFELGMAEKDIDGKFGDATNARYKKELGF